MTFTVEFVRAADKSPITDYTAEDTVLPNVGDLVTLKYKDNSTHRLEVQKRDFWYMADGTLYKVSFLCGEAAAPWGKL